MKKLRLREVNFPKVVPLASGGVAVEPKQLDLQVSPVSLPGSMLGSGSHPVTLGKSFSFVGTLFSSFKKEGMITKGSLSFYPVIDFPKSRSFHLSTSIF